MNQTPPALTAGAGSARSRRRIHQITAYAATASATPTNSPDWNTSAGGVRKSPLNQTPRTWNGEAYVGTFPPWEMTPLKSSSRPSSDTEAISAVIRTTPTKTVAWRAIGTHRLGLM